MSLARRAVAVVLLAATATGCADVQPYVAALDALPLPSSFEAVKTVTEVGIDICATCRQAHRYYVASGELTDLLDVLKQAIAQAGYTSLQVGAPTCDLNDNTGLACTVGAKKDGIHLLANVYRSGSDVDSLGLSQPGKSTIRITATNV
jgi:hypothetical protein